MVHIWVLRSHTQWFRFMPMLRCVESRLSSGLSNCMSPPGFNGKTTAIKAKKWRRQVRQIMDIIGILEDIDRVSLAFFHLISIADD